MSKESILNRKGQKVVVLIDEKKKSKGLAFVMHGLSGNKEQPHIQVIAKSFAGNGYTVVRFDTTNTFGESDGNYEDATITNYYEDLEDVISWASKQKWYKEMLLPPQQRMKPSNLLKPKMLRSCKKLVINYLKPLRNA